MGAEAISSLILEKHGFQGHVLRLTVVAGKTIISHHFHGKTSSTDEVEDTQACFFGGSLHVINWEGAAAECCCHGVSSCCFQNVRLVFPWQFSALA